MRPAMKPKVLENAPSPPSTATTWFRSTLMDASRTHASQRVSPTNRRRWQLGTELHDTCYARSECCEPIDASTTTIFQCTQHAAELKPKDDACTPLPSVQINSSVGFDNRSFDPWGARKNDLTSEQPRSTKSTM